MPKTLRERSEGTDTYYLIRKTVSYSRITLL
jgi:hypothetical protein